MSSNIFVLITQVLGSCLLTVPFIIYKVGWVLSIVIMVHSVASMLFTMYYYIEACYYTRAMSYKDLTKKLLGNKFANLLDVSIIVSYYGFMTAYIIISSQSVVTFTKNVFGYQLNKYLVKSVIACCVIFPLTLLKSLKQLSQISTVAGLLIFVFVGTMVVYFFHGLSGSQTCAFSSSDGSQTAISYALPAFPRADLWTALLQFVMYVPSMHGNFSSHPVIPRLLKESLGSYLQKRRFTHGPLRATMLLAAACFSAVGFMGAAMFGRFVTQNVLEAFGPCRFVWIDVLSLLYAFVVIINFPLVLYPIKTSLVQTFGDQIETKRGYRISVAIDAAFLVLTLALALFLESIVSIFGLFASVAGFFYYFFMPGYCFIVHKQLRKQNESLDEP